VRHRGDHDRVGCGFFEVADALGELRDELECLLERHADGQLRTAEEALGAVLRPAPLHLVEHRCADVRRESGSEELRLDADGACDRSIRLLPAVCLDAFDQAGSKEHANVEVEVTRIHTESLGELAGREGAVVGRSERLEHAKAKGVAKRLELLGAVDYEDISNRSTRPHAAI
jgi:hypothetical protein